MYPLNLHIVLIPLLTLTFMILGLAKSDWALHWAAVNALVTFSRTTRYPDILDNM